MAIHVYYSKNILDFQELLLNKKEFEMKKDYPLYEAVAIRDFRDLVENAADKYSDKIAYSYKVSPLTTRP